MVGCFDSCLILRCCDCSSCLKVLLVSILNLWVCVVLMGLLGCVWLVVW